MQRITNKELDQVCRRINTAAGFDANPTYPQGYHMGGAYGGVRLEYPAQSDGVRLDACGTGYVTKREAYAAMVAYLNGLQAHKKA